MAGFCGKCGAEIKDNALFCGKCGEKIGAAECISSPSLSYVKATDGPKKFRWTLPALEQVICVVLFFLPNLVLEAFGYGKNITIMSLVSEAGYTVVYVVILVLLFISAVVMILPMLQNKPLESKHLMFFQIMSVLFFVVNIIVYFVIGAAVKQKGYGIVEYKLNIWGWLYFIMSIVSNIDLLMLSLKVKKNQAVQTYRR